jgi:hypothetical protein
VSSNLFHRRHSLLLTLEEECELWRYVHIVLEVNLQLSWVLSVIKWKQKKEFLLWRKFPLCWE